MRRIFDDYLKAVKLQFEQEKDGTYASYFLMPSPAQLRELCLFFFDNGLSNQDKKVFEIFFKSKEGELLRRDIEQVDVDKFRPIVNFFKGKNERTSSPSVELIAVLLDFKPRPFHLFLKQDEKMQEEEVERESLAEELDEVEIGKERITAEKMPEESDSPILFTSFQEPAKKQMTIPRSVFLVLIAISIIAVGYIAKDICFPAKECMQWQKDRYVAVDCQSEAQGFLTVMEKKPLQKELLEFRKIEVTPATKLFEYDKPLVWYCKQNKKVEFFNQPGVHPVTGKPLKPITHYMANEHGKK